MKKKGRLIVIEGTDGSGKQTQSKLLHEKLKKAEIPSLLIHFPDYSSASSALVKMYLQGDFGSRPEDVNPFAASIFYACDRFASYRKKWQPQYEEGCFIIADRYTTSNMVHQGAKFQSQAETFEFIRWLENLEYTIFGIPEPDRVLFLDMPPAYAQTLMAARANKITGELQKDIHERDKDYLARSYEASCGIAEALGWIPISCTKEGRLKTVEEISSGVWEATMEAAL